MQHTGNVRPIPWAFLLALAIIVAGGAAPVHGASFSVDATHDAVDASPGDGVCADAGGACTLRAVVMETNALPGADEISLPAGTYVLSIPGAGEDASATGDLDIADNLILNGAGLTTTVINAGGLDRAIHIVGGIQVDAHDMSLTNGSAGTSTGGSVCNPFPTQENGGGICNESGIVRLIRVSITNSSATRHGEAIWNAGVIEIESSSITDNLQDAAFTNGDQLNEGTAMLRATSVSNNGRGLRNFGTAILTDSVFDHNLNGVENWGGTLTMNGGQVNSNTQFGLVNFGDTMTLSNVTVHANGSLGILNEMPGELAVIGSTISNNAGGGVSSSVGQPIDTPVVPGTLAITNSTLSGNLQGGIISGGNIALVNVTIAHNTGVGLAQADRPYLLTTTLHSTIIANSTGPNCSGLMTSLGHNLDSDGTCGLTAVGDFPNVDPLLHPLADNGGPTQTHALAQGGCAGDLCFIPSPAIDAGDNAACPVTDQRGQPRPFDGNGDGISECDKGAYEVQEPPFDCAPQCGVTPGPPTSTPTPSLPIALPPTGAAGGEASFPLALLAVLPAIALAVAALVFCRRNALRRD